MAHIIAGRFLTKDRADVVAATLRRYVGASDICIFHNNSPGQHGTYAMGGDENVDPGAEGAAETSIGTAVAAGVATGAVALAAGPVVALAAAGVAAYTGSLVGALGGLGEDGKHPLPNRRPVGVILAVRIANPTDEQTVIHDLRNGGAEDVEESDGEWKDGDWVGFNPVESPRILATQVRGID